MVQFLYNNINYSTIKILLFYTNYSYHPGFLEIPLEKQPVADITKNIIIFIEYMYA